MIAITPHTTATVPDPVESAGDTASQALDTARKTGTRGRFYDEMKVIGLGGEMYYAKVSATCASDRPTESQERWPRPQGRQVANGAERDMDRVAGIM